MDKLDEINLLKYYRRNIVKWWNIKPYTDADMCIIGDPDADYYDSIEAIDDELLLIEQSEADELAIPDIDILEDDQQDTVKAVLSRNEDTAFEDAIKHQQLEEANAIYERLMNEAAYDEAMKQAEIEAAKLGQVL